VGGPCAALPAGVVRVTWWARIVWRAGRRNLSDEASTRERPAAEGVRGGWLRSRLGLGRTVLLLLAFLALAALYACIFAKTPKNADCVNIYLMGLDMGRGNWRLAHWYVATDNFWPQEILAYAILTRIAGDSLFLMSILPAATWAGIVTTAWSLSRRDRSGEGRWWPLLVIAAALGVPIIADNRLMAFIAAAPVHLLTVLQALFLLSLADRYRRDGGPLALVAFALLAAAAGVGDPLVVFIVAAPVSGAALLCGDAPLARRWMLVGAALASVAAAQGLIALNEATGGFTIVETGGSHVRFAAFSDIGGHLALTLQALLGFWSADFADRSLMGALPHLLHLPIALVMAGTAAVAAAKLAQAALRLGSSNLPFLDCALVLGAGVIIAACVFSTQMIEFWSGRYVLPAVVFGVVLAARRAPAFRARAIAGALGLLGSIIAAGADPNYTEAFSHPRVRMNPDVRDLAHWLEDRGLDFGYAEYWSAGPLRAASHGKLEAATLISDEGHLEPFHLIVRDDWFPDSLTARRPFFVVIDPPGSFSDAFKESEAVEALGQPSERETVGPYVVDIYR